MGDFCNFCLSRQAQGDWERADAMGRTCRLPGAWHQLRFWKPFASLPFKHCLDAPVEICSLLLMPEFGSSSQMPLSCLVGSCALLGMCPGLAVLQPLVQQVPGAATTAFSNGVWPPAKRNLLWTPRKK